VTLRADDYILNVDVQLDLPLTPVPDGRAKLFYRLERDESA
jgi:hypothetical protein